MMLRSMRKVPERSGLLDSNASKSYEELFDGEIASELSKKGLGIADSLERLLSHQRRKWSRTEKYQLRPTISRSFALQDNGDQDGELKLLAGEPPTKRSTNFWS